MKMMYLRLFCWFRQRPLKEKLILIWFMASLVLMFSVVEAGAFEILTMTANFCLSAICLKRVDTTGIDNIQ